MCYGKESVSDDMEWIWGGYMRDGGEVCYGKESVSDDMEWIWGGHREMVVRCAMEKRVSVLT